MQVLLTRPLAQVAPLAKCVKQQGDSPLLFPTLVIQPLTAGQIPDTAQTLIFISANAVDCALTQLRNLTPEKLAKIIIAAVGVVTKNRLESYGFTVLVCPEKGASSQALLNTQYMKNLHHNQVLIIRGVGGLETLKDALVKQHNTIQYLEVYRRITPKLSPQHRCSMQQFLSQKQGIIVIHNISSLEGFTKLVKDIEVSLLTTLLSYPLVLFSPRILIMAKKIGFSRCFIAKTNNNAGLLQGLLVSRQNITKYSSPKI